MDPNATETEFKDAVIDLAHSFGWKVVHFRPAQTKHGWRTPVQGDGKGWPDLILVHRSGWLILAELKDRRGVLSKEQAEWRDTLTEVTEHLLMTRVKYFIWRPKDWSEIVRILSFGAAHA